MLANPDKLEFREKVLKFTAAAIESNEQPKLPSQPHNATNEFAVKAKETAFGGGGGERLAIPEESSNLQRINSESIDLIHNLEQEIHHSTHDLVVAEEVGDDD